MLSNVLAIDAGVIASIVVLVVILLAMALFIPARLKKCPSDKIMVVYGATGRNTVGSICIHGGVKFIWPIVQGYTFLDLTPISICVDLKQAVTRQNVRMNVQSIVTVAISTEPTLMQNAAEHLLGLGLGEIQGLAKDIIFGQFRLVISARDIDGINTNREEFLEAIVTNINLEINKIGLKLVNLNITDITDEEGYLDALGRDVASKAIEEVRMSIAIREATSKKAIEKAVRLIEESQE
ncbi:MAG: flotillin family protein [Clostridiales bacterium]|jgi:flotillin|nr:flotillin family protein [Clostridiales bacterium]